MATTDPNVPAGFIAYAGLGQLGNLSDPNNWVGGHVPGVHGRAAITRDATLNGSFSTFTFMGLGQGTITVNGTLTTTSTGTCNSFMACNGATFDFTPGSELNANGGCIVGQDAHGSLVAQGSATSHTRIDTGAVKIGQHGTGVGSVTINGATWTDSQDMYVGQYGQGALAITNGGSVTVAQGLVIGAMLGATGVVNITGNSTLSSAADTRVGGNPLSVSGGTGSVTVGAGGLFASGGTLSVLAQGTITLAGGSVTAGAAGQAILAGQGASLSGFGTVSATASGASISDNGTITATGGTLALTGTLTGTGTLKIGANSTAQVATGVLGVARIAFTGPDATLVAHSISSQTTISGFVAGDSLLMSGVSTLGWDGTHDVLTLSAGNQVVDQLHFAGNYAGQTFSLAHVGNETIISVGPVLTHH